MALPEQRSAGICMHFTALPGRYGIGELGANAHRFIDFLAACGLRVWQFLPTGPTTYGNSPYQPMSIFAGNPMLIDIASLVNDKLLAPDEVISLTKLAQDNVDYSALVPLKTDLLSKACERFIGQANNARQAAFESFCAANDQGWLHDFAMFQSLATLHNECGWQEWSEPIRERDDNAMAAFAKEASESIKKVKVAQFLFAEQWQALRAHAAKEGVLLFGDIPIYLSLDSADAWAGGELLCLDINKQPVEVAGVPPDYFSADGQLWGNPLYNWTYHEGTGFQWWIARMRHAIAQNDMVRIDHFRGFESYWAVPAYSTTARDGRWCKGPGDAIFTAMRDAIGALPIVAEDLGMITEEVDELRERQHFPGMKVLQFLLEEPDFALDQIPENSVCYTGTHDNDTTYGWFHGGPGDNRSAGQIEKIRASALALTGGSQANVVRDLVKLALASPARIAVAPMQDILNLGTEARFNIPGTVDGNWRWRLSAGDLSTELAGRVHQWVASAGRCPAALVQSE